MPRDQLALLGRTASGCPSRVMSGHARFWRERKHWRMPYLPKSPQCRKRQILLALPGNLTSTKIFYNSEDNLLCLAQMNSLNQ